ncbi:hypothetical protein BDV93DRAFT_520667 [Ceratobasidium sp. AG-I]|nr:hypothetical protein BDV93DRAFT_520667 [Ceratobasidium sp. AG-I]
MHEIHNRSEALSSTTLSRQVPIDTNFQPTLQLGYRNKSAPHMCLPEEAVSRHVLCRNAVNSPLFGTALQNGFPRLSVDHPLRALVCSYPYIIYF